MNEQYVMVNINLPLKICNDGSVEPMNDYIQTNFSKCNELPLKPSNDCDYTFLANNILEYFTNATVAESATTSCITPSVVDTSRPLNLQTPSTLSTEFSRLPTHNVPFGSGSLQSLSIFIDKNEIRNNEKNVKKQLFNTTFKNKRYYSNRFTEKAR